MLGALVGVVSGVVVFGPGFVWGDPTYWRYLWGDAGSGYAAFRYFVAEGWSFPLLEAQGLNHPDGISVAFTDSLPVLALLAKLLDPFGLDPGRWWGWWFVLLHVLQGASAAWAARAWGNRSAVVALSVAAIAVSAPILLIRTWHPGLAGQFVLLLAWGGVGCLRGESPSGDGRRRFVVGSAALCLLTLLIHVYLLVGVLVVLAGGVGDQVARRRWRPRDAARWVAVVIVTLIGGGLIFGYFTAGAAAAPGYDTVGMHLFGPFVAQQSTLWPGNEWTILASGSFESFNWLGFGWLALVAIAVAVIRPGPLADGVRRHQVTAALLVLLAAYSITPVIRLWDDDPHDLRTPLAWWVDDPAVRRWIWAIGLLAVVVVVTVVLRRRAAWLQRWGPAWFVVGAGLTVLGGSLATSMVLVDAVTGQFRSAGRMFWPVSYGSLVIAAGLIGRRVADSAIEGADRPTGWNRRVALVGLCALCAVVQVVDVASWRNLASTTLDPTPERRARLDGIAALIGDADSIVLEPSFTCAQDYGGTEGLWTFQDVGIVASWDGLGVNRAYGARQRYEQCDAILDRELAEGQVLVVVLPEEVADALVVVDESWTCDRRELVLACR